MGDLYSLDGEMRSPDPQKFWFIFGEHGDGRVDVADEHGDLLTGVSQKEAERICDDHKCSGIEVRRTPLRRQRIRTSLAVNAEEEVLILFGGQGSNHPGPRYTYPWIKRITKKMREIAANLRVVIPNDMKELIDDANKPKRPRLRKPSKFVNKLHPNDPRRTILAQKKWRKNDDGFWNFE